MIQLEVTLRFESEGHTVTIVADDMPTKPNVEQWYAIHVEEAYARLAPKITNSIRALVGDVRLAQGCPEEIMARGFQQQPQADDTINP